MNTEKEIRNIWKIIFLHLIPGLALCLVYILFSKVGVFEGYPRVVTLGVSTIFSIIPIELGYLFYVTKKEEGDFHLLKILGLKSKLKAGSFVLYMFLMLLIGIILLIVLKPVADFLLRTAFGWIPDWYNFVQDMSQFDRSGIIAATVVSFFVLTLLVPVVEEFYFRGFLLDRMKWMGVCSVLLNVVLYSAYHFYQPWFIVTRALAMLPIYYWVYKKDSLKLAIVVHSLANSVDVISYIALLL